MRPSGDLYALGVVGYFLLTGDTPFSGESFLEISMHHLNTKPERPSSRLGRPVPEDLENSILACLAKETADRPASAEALDAALGGCRDAGGWGQAEAKAWWEKRAAPR
jgi:serine/threonine-protein kinase